MLKLSPGRAGLVFVFLLLASIAGTAVAASGGAGPRGVGAPPAGKPAAGPQHLADGPVEVMVELEGQPAAAAATGARRRGLSRGVAAARGRAQRAANAQAQEGVVGGMRRRDLADRVIFRVASAYNGVAVRTTRARLRRLAALDGVKAIHPLPRYHPTNERSVPLVGAPGAWAGTPGRTGTGIKIGIIDTGIDYTHAAFGGAGAPADFTAAGTAANNPATSESAPSGFTAANAGRQLFPTAKVAGGFDFAGDGYGAAGVAPAPDPNPLDCNGHGSHVAGTAAGYGVTKTGETFAGPFTDPLPDGMRVGPGVAPGATLYALRVFGCSGSTALVTQALDWAVDPNHDGDTSDRLDVVNLSLGGSFGGEDVASVAAANAVVAAGVVVVGSAGNAGDVTGVLGGPGAARRALSVAGSRAAQRRDAFRVNAPAAIAGLHVATESVNYGWSAAAPVTANLYRPASNSVGCSPWSGADAAGIAGSIVLLDLRTGTGSTVPCSSTVRASYAKSAGAAGMVLIDNVDGFPTAISGNSTLPAVYTDKTTGDLLLGQLIAGVASQVSVTLSHEWNDTILGRDHEDLLYASSSRGPRTADGGLKPDLTAPGEDIVSVGSGTGTAGVAFNGTSMAAPHVAGAMALLREAHPGWTVEELKARAMNTAGQDLYVGAGHTGTKYSPQRVGAGRLKVDAALDGGVVAYGDQEGAVGLSFGALEVAGSLTREKTVRLVNKGSEARSYEVAFDPRSTVPGVTYDLPDGSTVTVPAGGEATVRVRLSADAGAMRHVIDPTFDPAQGPVQRQALAEATGLVTFTPAGGAGPALRVPAHAAARPVSEMRTTRSRIVLAGATASGELTLSGSPLDQGDGIEDYRGVVFPFEHQGSSDKLANLPEAARPADLRDVGVASDVSARIAAGGTVGQGVIYFGISTWGRWMVPSFEEVEFDVLIDTDRDGTPDYVIWNTRLSGTDQFVVAYQNLRAGAASAEAYTNGFRAGSLRTAPFNSDVMVLPVVASRLGLTAGSSRFNYSVRTYSRTGGTVVDSVENRTYDPAKPGLDATGGLTGPPATYDRPAEKVPYTLDRANLTANGSTGILMLRYLNGTGSRAETIAVDPGNQAPVAALEAIADVGEGDGLDLDASASSDPDEADTLAYDWDVNGDGHFGDASGATPSLTSARMAELGLGDGPRTVTTTVKVSDGEADATASKTFAVTNRAPVATVGDPAGIVDAGETVSLGVTSTDPSATDEASGLRYRVAWGTDTPDADAVDGPTISHAFTDGGSYAVKVWAVDKDGTLSETPAQTTVKVRARTTTTLACTPLTVPLNRVSVCTATVTAAGGGRPAGELSLPGDATCTLPATGENRCTFSHRGAAVGSEQVTARYGGSDDHMAGEASRTLTITGPAPAGRSLPLVSGPRRAGAQLTTTEGSWDHEPTRFAYSWWRCNDRGYACARITTDDATDDGDYTLTEADSGARIRSGVTAINAFGRTLRTSPPTLAVDAPVLVLRPRISGLRRSGETLSATSGGFDPAATRHDYQWLRCNAVGTGCAEVGDDAATYALTAADAGHTMRVRVTASNAAGRAIATSAQSTVVDAPAVVRWPSARGVMRSGETLTADPGEWSPLADGYAYQWLRCDRFGLLCAPVGTGATYTLTGEDAGGRMRVRVTATNAVGSGVTSSPTTSVIADALP